MTMEDLLKRIESYPKGFEFTLPYNKMTKAVRNTAYELTKKATDLGLIESISTGAGWNDDGTFDGFQCETFRRI